MRLEALRRAYKIAENVSVNYDGMTPEEIKELDDALDTVFTLAKQKIIEAEAEIDKKERLKAQHKNKCRDCSFFGFAGGGLHKSRGNCSLRDPYFYEDRKASNKACKQFEES